MTDQDKPACMVDPVCNLDLQAQHGKFMYDFEDVTYYFCSQSCRDEFAQQPEKYTKNKGGV